MHPESLYYLALSFLLGWIPLIWYVYREEVQFRGAVDPKVKAYSNREEWLRDIYGDVPLDTITARLKISPPDVLKRAKAEEPDDDEEGFGAVDMLSGVLTAAAVAFAPAAARCLLGNPLDGKRRKTPAV